MNGYSNAPQQNDVWLAVVLGAAVAHLGHSREREAGELQRTRIAIGWRTSRSAASGKGCLWSGFAGLQVLATCQ
jgi:hypothetical protein